jgi:hypothetical protein
VNFGAQLVLVALASCVYPLLQVGEGGCVDGRTPFAPTPRSHAEIVQGAPPCAPTPRSHRVGEGLGVRANTSERQHRDRLGDQRECYPEHAD